MDPSSAREISYYKPIRAGNFYKNTYIKYKSNDDKNKTVSFKKYIDLTKLHLKDDINDFTKKSEKIKLTIAINFMPFKDNDINM